MGHDKNIFGFLSVLLVALLADYEFIKSNEPKAY